MHAAFREGDLAETGLRLLTETWSPAVADDFNRDEPMLLSWATSLPSKDLSMLLDTWRAVNAEPLPPPPLLFALASDLLDHPGLLRRLLDDAQTAGREIAEFNFNITDLTVDCTTGSAVISDVLYGDAVSATLRTAALLMPFDFADDLRPRFLSFVKRKFGMQWRDAIVWLAALPETSQNPERVVAAAIVQSRGRLDELAHAVSLGAPTGETFS